MHFNTIDCHICGVTILDNDDEIKNHLFSHENEWIESLRSKYEVSLDCYDI